MPEQNNIINSLAHTKWNCKYHIVFAPNYRRKVFFEEKRLEIREILRTLCRWKEKFFRTRYICRCKGFKELTPIYPELSCIYKCVKKSVILDGKHIDLADGKPDFYALQRRSPMTDAFRILLAAKKNPVQFVIYDIIYCEEKGRSC